MDEYHSATVMQHISIIQNSHAKASQYLLIHHKNIIIVHSTMKITLNVRTKKTYHEDYVHKAMKML